MSNPPETIVCRDCPKLFKEPEKADAHFKVAKHRSTKEEIPVIPMDPIPVADVQPTDGRRISKMDFITIHVVLYRTRLELLRIGLAKPEDFAEYDALEIKAVNLGLSKERHHAAIRVLAKAINKAWDRTKTTLPIPLAG